MKKNAYRSDLFANLPADARFDLIIGNPPHNLDQGSANRHLDTVIYIQAHDPKLEIHRRFFTEAVRHLAPDGLICLLENGAPGCIEIGHLRDLLSGSPDLEIRDWQWMSGSWFYAVTIGRVATELRLNEGPELTVVRQDAAKAGHASSPDSGIVQRR